jgi:hypothetical protein
LLQNVFGLILERCICPHSASQIPVPVRSIVDFAPVSFQICAGLRRTRFEAEGLAN